MQTNTAHPDPTQHKFTLLVIGLTVVIILLLAVIIALLFFRGNPTPNNTANSTTSSFNASNSATQATTTKTSASSANESYPNWQSDETGAWKAMTTPPECADPFIIQSPVDINKAESILYPGQARGGDYKSHGGIRFPATSASVSVKAPYDAYLVRASRYIQDNEVQYFFVFISSCGMMYRFDHLLTLTPKFQAIADALPPAMVNDSRTQFINPPILIKAGEEVATEIGFRLTMNIGVDFGMNDLRQPNEISKNAAWAAAHPEKEFDHYGVCWLDYLPEPDKTKAYSLPGGDGVMGKTSDYCN